ncbi:MAG: diguanylate cyclase [Steroidobacteraceae bacterium]|jgi:diguanylate cyclase (GGDEF)-like protein
MQAREAFSILLVDDDSMVVRIMSRILSDFEPLRFATSGHMALKLARESVPDLVLLDVDIPELSGFEICKAFKSDPALTQVPIIFVTSHESAQLEAMGLHLGAADFISKPPHAALVLARVRTFQRMKMLSDTLRGAVKMDFLTGAATRRQLEKGLMQEWVRARRTGAPLSLLLADIDGFTAYNAEFGEEQGDVCLRRIADALRSAAHRPSDVLGRYAGGAFALLLPETAAQAANVVAQRAIDAVDALQILHAASTGRGHITLSVGGGCRDSSRSPSKNAAAGSSAETSVEGAVPDDLIAAAEQAIKSAKSAGGHLARLVVIDERSESQAISSRS